MGDDVISASLVINASAEAVFAVLADPATHAAIDGTGWVREPRATESLTAAGQLFRMSMYHPAHPVGDYVTVNRVEVFDPPRSVSWRTGYETDNGTLVLGGWSWRYDLAPAAAASTRVRLSYDWSATSDATRRRIGFPPFAPEHLENSLVRLAGLIDA